VSPAHPHIHQASDIPGLNYEFIPNLKDAPGYNGESISTNSLGFRGPEFDPEKSTIVNIGDSFAFGFGVEDDETNMEPLREAFANMNILNVAVNGYNIEQEARAYVAKFHDLKPLVGIVQFTFNDMRPPSILSPADVEPLEDYLSRTTIDARLAEDISKPGTLPIPFKFWLTTHSAFFRFIEKRTKWLPFRSHAEISAEDSITQADLNMYETWFGKLTSALDGASKIFVIWPESAPHNFSRAALRAMAEKRGYLVLDLYETFGAGYPSLSWDWHPSAATQKRVGELLVELIRSHHLLPL